PMWSSASRPGRSRTRSRQAQAPSRTEESTMTPAAVARFLSRKWGSITTSTPERQVPTSKEQHQRNARATEIHTRVAQREARNRLVAECMEVANIAARTDVLAPHDDPAADVPPEVVVVGREQAYRGEVHVGPDEAEAEERIRTDRPDVGHEHSVAH